MHEVRARGNLRDVIQNRTHSRASMRGFSGRKHHDKKMNLKIAGIISVMVALITIAIHTLVILKIMPFSWINGGRSETFEIAKQTSTISIIILIFSIIISIYVI
ncbi:hypothetical protein DESME_02330 [Desulfitobacterium metallireducens DSM 15288]|uniref:Uncharacterized protein n=1 Tax=Desulfitobacterium metallireducens DSM 15288 TaxID=871968 RepID=W0ECC7_9FIRM|nr:hypothetical protein DESME_02330 [Desulfitobacterium metallireducens DSM 15288]